MMYREENVDNSLDFDYWSFDVGRTILRSMLFLYMD